MRPNPLADTRPPAVAGLFYPGERAALASEVTKLLTGAKRGGTNDRGAPKALIAPHAGYVYSGPIAANAYALLEPVRDTIRRVVLLGPTHRVAVRGLALPRAKRFATPLGVVEIDAEAVERLKALPRSGRAESADRTACGLRLFGADRGECLCAARAGARHDPPRRAARTDPSRGGARARAAACEALRDAARRGRDRRRGGRAPESAAEIGARRKR